MTATTRALLACLLSAAGVAIGADAGNARVDALQAKRPELRLRAAPKLAFVPAKVQFIATLEGGDDDYQEFYCPSIEWDWDDDTTSESSPDCEPYQPGQSRIIRRYTAQHIFQFEGIHEVKFKLKSKGRTIALTTVSVEVRPGH